MTTTMAGSRHLPFLRAGALACLFVAGFFIGKSEILSGRAEAPPLAAAEKKEQAPTAKADPAEPKLSDELTRQMQLKDQAEFDQGVSFPGLGLTIVPFEKGWIITDELARLLALSPGDRQAAQQAIDRSRQAFEALARDHLQSSTVDGAALALKIRPHMREGHAQLDKLRSDLRKVLPDEVGEELFRAFRYSSTFGAFGANEVEIHFSNPADSPDAKSVRFIRKHSMTGKVLADYLCTEAELEQRTGFTRGMF